MNGKNLMSQIVSPIAIQDLSAELVEMSEEELQQVVGGNITVTVKPDGTIVVKVTR